jgi:phenylpropionate dioxygenase-like ring-hydroxylating dioxygenase large terminal subunit
VTPAANDLRNATTLPASAYHDPAVYEHERRAIFAREWQLAGFRAQLRPPGDFVAHDVAGWQVFVVVCPDGTLRGFHNVCRHRAGPLVTEPSGSCRNLVCRYHGWSYDFDGALLAARDFGDADGFDPGDYGLLPVRVDEWRGLVFVHLQADALPLEEQLGTLFAECVDLPVETLDYSHRVVHDLACNWKTYADNYSEGYHIPLVHPELNREVSARQYRVEVHDHYCVHRAPARDGAIYAGTWLWRYPNLALNLYPDGMTVERFVPTGPRSTRIVYDYFFADGSAAAAGANAEKVRISRDVVDEDRGICEAVQRNLESGVYDTGRLSPRHENGVHAFQQWVRASLARHPAQSASAGSSSRDRELMQ